MRNNTKRWIGAAILYIMIFLMVFWMTGCSSIPFLDRDIVVKQKRVPCPAIEPAQYCAVRDLGRPPTARSSLLYNAYYEHMIACLMRREELRHQARADCAE